eukprot:TRINITY_DN4802_c0_g1_i1.p1 TRINITY_DN4802_c0_g1~~TRINITY_DN4802_c0_g1_i1.p1  ORF type:complete len:275 (+),score=41.24 TRINITY_DN4802_c0_g1_i1:382-1206(+)
MCNPPFFSQDEYEAKTNFNPKTVRTAAANELFTEGGELTFLKKMISDSLLFRDNVEWFTTLVGKKKDLKLLKRQLASFSIYNVREKVFTTAKSRVARWGLAWSFNLQNGFVKAIRELPFRKTRSFTVDCSGEGLLDQIQDALTSLDILSDYSCSDSKFVCQVAQTKFVPKLKEYRSKLLELEHISLEATGNAASLEALDEIRTSLEDVVEMLKNSVEPLFTFSISILSTSRSQWLLKFSFESGKPEFIEATSEAAPASFASIFQHVRSSVLANM